MNKAQDEHDWKSTALALAAALEFYVPQHIYLRHTVAYKAFQHLPQEVKDALYGQGHNEE